MHTIETPVRSVPAQNGQPEGLRDEKLDKEIGSVGCPPGSGNRLLNAVRLCIGTVAARICPASLPCRYSGCSLQPYCRCARAHWTHGSRREGKVWAVIIVSAVIVLLVTMGRALWNG